MSDEKFYVRFRGRTLGPFDEGKVRGLIKRGQVTRMHELSPDGVSWQKADAFPELFPAASQPTQAFEQTDQSHDSMPPDEPNTGVAEWYAHMNDENKGPVTKNQIAQWIAAGAITQESLVWKEGTEEWEPANIAVPELFAGASLSGPNFAAAQALEPAPLSSKPCPFCQQLISSVAVKCQHCQSMLNNFCSNCGTQCGANQAVCLNCGTSIESNANETVVIAQPSVVQPNVNVAYVQGHYNKSTAAILALLIGGLGAHKFYHGSIGWGIMYLVFCPTFIPAIVSLIEAIVYLSMPQADYDSRYNLTPPEPFKW
ncbi:GYF domain-containing protein [bacterium]|nr:GYF domain-containing protein [bacterium]